MVGSDGERGVFCLEQTFHANVRACVLAWRVCGVVNVRGYSWGSNGGGREEMHLRCMIHLERRCHAASGKPPKPSPRWGKVFWLQNLFTIFFPMSIEL